MKKNKVKHIIIDLEDLATEMDSDRATLIYDAVALLEKAIHNLYE